MAFMDMEPINEEHDMAENVRILIINAMIPENHPCELLRIQEIFITSVTGDFMLFAG